MCVWHPHIHTFETKVVSGMGIPDQREKWKVKWTRETTTVWVFEKNYHARGWKDASWFCKGIRLFVCRSYSIHSFEAFSLTGVFLHLAVIKNSLEQNVDEKIEKKSKIFNVGSPTTYLRTWYNDLWKTETQFYVQFACFSKLITHTIKKNLMLECE